MRLPATLAVVIAAFCAAACGSKAPDGGATLAGAWRSSVQFQSGAFAEVKDLEFMYVFNDGGTLTESSNYDSAPPVPPAYGAWKQTGPGAFEARYEFFTTAPSGPDDFARGAGWLPSGHGVLTEQITLAPDGRTFTSRIRYEPFDSSGHAVAGGGEAEGRGTRIGS